MVELTSEDALREWLPKLVGIEGSVLVRLADGSEVRGRASDEDEARLTRADITAAVHFIKFSFAPAQAPLFEPGPVHLVVDHPEYRQDVEITADQRAVLAGDLLDLT